MLTRNYFCPVLLKRVSRIGMGGWQAGGLHINNDRSIGWQDVDRAEVCRTMALALEQGINIFDTSDSYGPDFESVRLLATVLKGVPRSSYVIACKIGYTRGVRGGDFLSPRNIEERLARTLDILRTDHVDVFSLHHHGAGREILPQLRESVALVRSRGWASAIAARVGHQSTVVKTAPPPDRHGHAEDLEIAEALGARILCLNASAALAKRFRPADDTVQYFNKPFRQGLIFARETPFLQGDNRYNKEEFAVPFRNVLVELKRKTGVTDSAIVNHVLSQLYATYPLSTTFVGMRNRSQLSAVIAHLNAVSHIIQNEVKDYLERCQLHLNSLGRWEPDGMSRTRAE